MAARAVSLTHVKILTAIENWGRADQGALRSWSSTGPSLIASNAWQTVAADCASERRSPRTIAGDRASPGRPKTAPRIRSRLQKAVPSARSIGSGQPSETRRASDSQRPGNLDTAFLVRREPSGSAKALSRTRKGPRRWNSAARNLPASKVSKASCVPRTPKRVTPNPKRGRAAKAASSRRRSQKAARTARRRGWGRVAAGVLASSDSRKEKRRPIIGRRPPSAGPGSEGDGGRVNCASARRAVFTGQYSKP